MNSVLFDNHCRESSNCPSQRGPVLNVSDKGELLEYLMESKKLHKSPHLTETPLLNIYMKTLRLQEYQGKTSKFDLTQSQTKKSPTVISNFNKKASEPALKGGNNKSNNNTVVSNENFKAINLSKRFSSFFP